MKCGAQKYKIWYNKIIQEWIVGDIMKLYIKIMIANKMMIVSKYQHMQTYRIIQQSIIKAEKTSPSKQIQLFPYDALTLNSFLANPTITNTNVFYPWHIAEQKLL